MSTMNKITLLRQWMREQDLAAFIFPSTDPHSGEYVPDHWKTREWISGFNGSAGTAVVALDDAALWTDSRYWLAAEEQTAGTGFTVIRCRRNVPTGQELAEWIKEKCKPTLYGAPLRVGIDGWVNTTSSVHELQHELSPLGLQLVMAPDPAEELWAGRPPIPLNPIEIQPIEYAGEEGDVVECQRGEDVAVDGGSLVHAAVGNGCGSAKAFGKGQPDGLGHGIRVGHGQRHVL